MLPNRTFVFSQEGKDFLKRKEVGAAEAITYYLAQPTTPDNLIHLAFFLSLNNQRSLAREKLLEAIKLTQGENNLHTMWVSFFESYEQHHLAFTLYEHTSISDIQNLYIGNAALAWGKLDKARDALAGALGMRPDIISARKAGMLYHLAKLNSGDLRRAADYFSNVDGKKSTNGHLYYLAKLGFQNDFEYESIDSSWTSYFAALFGKEKIKRIERFKHIARDASAPDHLRMLAALALAQMDSGYFDDFVKVYNEVYPANFYPAINNVEANCVYAIATRFMHKQLILKNAAPAEIDKYQDIIRGFLLTQSPIAHNVLLPLSIPFYLRNAFMEVMLDKNYWPTVPLTFAQTDQLALIKEQYLFLVAGHSDAKHTGLDEETRKNMAIQGICTQTTIGRVIDVPQSNWGYTTLNSGTKMQFIAFIENNLSEDDVMKGCLSASSLQALKEQNPTFFAFIKEPISSCLKKQPTKKLYEDEKQREAKHNEKSATVAFLYDSVLALANENKLNLAMQLFMEKTRNRTDQDLYAMCDLGEYFFVKKSYRLAYHAYMSYFSLNLDPSQVHHFTSDQIIRGFLAALVVNRFDDALLFLNGFKKAVGLRDVYRDELRSQVERLRAETFAHEPQGLQNLTIKLDCSALTGLIEKAKTTNCNLMAEFYLASWEFVAGSIDLAEAKFESIYKELEVTKDFNICSPILADFLRDTLGYLGRIAFLKKDFNKAEAYFNKLQPASVALNVYQFIPYLKTLLELKKIEQAKAFIESCKKANKNLNPFLLLYACALIAKTDKSYIAVLKTNLEETSLAKIDVTNMAEMKQFTAKELAFLAIAYAQLGEVNKVKALLQNSKIAPQYLLIHELDPCQEDYLDLLVRKKYAPETVPDVNYFGLKDTKESYVHVVKQTGNWNVGFQALCPDTPIGRVFAIKRSTTNTSFTKGSLKHMLDVLEEQLAVIKKRNANKPYNEKEKINLLPSTYRALTRLQESNVDLFNSHPLVKSICIESRRKYQEMLFGKLPPSANSPVSQLPEARKKEQERTQDRIFEL